MFAGDQGVRGAAPHPPRVLRGDGDQAAQGGETSFLLQTFITFCENSFVQCYDLPAGDPVRPPWHWQDLAGQGSRQPDQRNLPQSGQFESLIALNSFAIPTLANLIFTCTICQVGSELIQKYLGDGPKLVRELFRVADEHSPSIVFIDEIDAVGTKR